jgi:hypothetical protein
MLTHRHFVSPAEGGTEREAGAAVAACQLALALFALLGPRFRGDDGKGWVPAFAG